MPLGSSYFRVSLNIAVKIAFCASLVDPFTSPAYPWGSKGHEIVAALAETQLTAARKRIKELLPRRGVDVAG
jgi:hypothetical protein